MAGKCEYVKLEEIIAKKLGSVDPSKFPDEVFDLYSIPAFDDGKYEVVKGSEIGSSKQLVQENDVMVSKIVPHIRRAWIVGKKSNNRMIASGEWIVFRSNRFHPEYLRYVVTSDFFHTQFMATVAGVGGSLLRARPAQVSQIQIPLPSLEEQMRIAAILDSANAIRTKRKAAIAKLDELAQAIFQDMFGDPVKNEKGWDTIKFYELIENFKYGTSNKSQQIGYPTLRIPNVIGGNTNYQDMKNVPVSISDFRRLKLLDNDILFVRTNGNPEYVGRCCLYRNTESVENGYTQNNMIYASYLIRARIKSMSPVNTVYLRDFLSGPCGKKQLLSKAKTSAGQYNINIESLGAIDILLPPISIQNIYSKKIEELVGIKKKYIGLLQHEDSLFYALQQRAFSGEV